MFTAVLVAIFAASGVTFVLLLFVRAPYGRYMRPGWGLALPSKWAWAIMEAPAAVVIAAMALRGNDVDPISLVLLAAWEIHYVYRTVLYPLLMHEGRRRNFPAVLALMAIGYNCANGYVNGYHLFVRTGFYEAGWATDPRFITGMIVFVTGFVTHVRADATLRNLRDPGETAYRIPHGGLFRWVSSPNYLGEIVQWSGFALASWSLAGLSFAVFTIANLLPRALANHRWYRETFPDYPEQRAAIIPHVL